ncbi:hypothetical protein CISIN_1g0206321mg, partial [Citrus sinensis]
KGSTLYIDLAKSNSRSKRSRTDDEWTGSDKKARGPSAFSRGTADLGIGSVHMPGMGNSAFNTIGYPHTQSHENFDARGGSLITTAKFNNSSAPSGPKNVTPCATLFVANLGPTCTEQELTQVFSKCPGFLKLKIQSTYGPPVAFVDFQVTCVCVCHILFSLLFKEKLSDGISSNWDQWRLRSWIQSFKCVEFAK